MMSTSSFLLGEYVYTVGGSFYGLVNLVIGLVSVICEGVLLTGMGL